MWYLHLIHQSVLCYEIWQDVEEEGRNEYCLLGKTVGVIETGEKHPWRLCDGMNKGFVFTWPHLLYCWLPGDFCRLPWTIALQRGRVCKENQPEPVTPVSSSDTGWCEKTGWEESCPLSGHNLIMYRICNVKMQTNYFANQPINHLTYFAMAPPLGKVKKKSYAL